MRALYVTLFALIADQASKFYVKGLKIESLGISIPGMPYGSSKQVFGDFVKLTFIENPGMAFGITFGPRVLLPIITFTASLFIIYYIYRHRKDTLLFRVALALILAGALGNLIDRSFYGIIYGYAPFLHGRVVDFVQVECWDFTLFGRTYTTWPILNAADLAVTSGFLLIVIFHKRIFKSSVEEPVQVSPEGEMQNTPGSETKDGSVQAQGSINILGSTNN